MPTWDQLLQLIDKLGPCWFLFAIFLLYSFRADQAHRAIRKQLDKLNGEED